MRSRLRAYSSWRDMKSRCSNQKRRQYKDYGGRGITVCKRWLKFENFYADMGERPPGLTLERVNNEKGYSPKNCRWATRAEQNANRRTRRDALTFYGRTVESWAAQWNMPIAKAKSNIYTLKRLALKDQ